MSSHQKEKKNKKEKEFKKRKQRGKWSHQISSPTQQGASSDVKWWYPLPLYCLTWHEYKDDPQINHAALLTMTEKTLLLFIKRWWRQMVSLINHVLGVSLLIKRGRSLIYSKLESVFIYTFWLLKYLICWRSRLIQ